MTERGRQGPDREVADADEPGGAHTRIAATAARLRDEPRVRTAPPARGDGALRVRTAPGQGGVRVRVRVRATLAAPRERLRGVRAAAPGGGTRATAPGVGARRMRAAAPGGGRRAR